MSEAPETSNQPLPLAEPCQRDDDVPPDLTKIGFEDVFVVAKNLADDFQKAFLKLSPSTLAKNPKLYSLQKEINQFAETCEQGENLSGCKLDAWVTSHALLLNALIKKAAKILAPSDIFLLSDSFEGWCTTLAEIMQAEEETGEVQDQRDQTSLELLIWLHDNDMLPKARADQLIDLVGSLRFFDQQWIILNQAQETLSSGVLLDDSSLPYDIDRMVVAFSNLFYDGDIPIFFYQNFDCIAYGDFKKCLEELKSGYIPKDFFQELLDGLTDFIITNRAKIMREVRGLKSQFCTVRA